MNYRFNKYKGFTLLEVVMVVAIIAVLVSVLAPRGIQAYKSAQLDSITSGHRTLMIAINESFIKNKTIFTGSTSIPNNTLETNLIQDNFIDYSVLSGMSLGSSVKINTIKVFNLTPCPMPFSPSFDGLYDINNDGVPDTCGQSIVELQVSGLTNKEGNDLSLRIDHASKTPAVGTTDLAGKVKFLIESGAGNNGIALILVEHK